MRRSTSSTVLVCIACFSLSGCFTVPQRDQLRATAHYAELAKFSEAEVALDPRTFKLYPLCIAYSNLKRYDKLFDCLNRLDANARSGDKWMYSVADMENVVPGFGKKTNDNRGFGDVIPSVLLLRAQAYLELGEYGKASSEARKLAGFTQYGSKTVSTHEIEGYSILGLANALQGNRTEATRYLRLLERTDIMPHANTSDIYDSVKKQVGLTRINLALGNYADALAAIKKDDQAFTRGAAGAIFSALVGTGESWVTELELPRRVMLAKCYLETGQSGGAKQEFDSILRMDQAKDNGEIYRIVLFERGRISEMEKDVGAALEFYKKAIDVIEEQRSSANTEAAKIGFVADKQEPYRRLIQLLVEGKQYEAAFEYVERARARALVDMLASKREFAAPTLSAEQVRQLLAARESAELDSRGFDASGSTSRSRNVVLDLSKKIAQASPELASLTSVTFVSASVLQRQIGDEEAMLEYYFDGTLLYAFVLTPRALRVVIQKTPTLVTDVQNFRKAVQRPASTTYVSAAAQLYDILIRPLEDLLGARNLIIVPHGPIHYVSFAALQDGRGFFIDRWSYRMLPSASVLTLLRTNHGNKTGELLAFGNPDVGDQRYDLINAQSEAVTVAGLFPKSRALVRREASKSAFQLYGSSFRYLHFATHGAFDAEFPMKSSLYLAGSSPAAGSLTVDDLYSLKLDVDLVVLSACETGLGKVASGDDVVGLTRGFLYAGASSIVASLWQVDDLSTSELMTTFYRELPALGKRDALRQALLETKKKYPHPFFWAAFQLTGLAL